MSRLLHLVVTLPLTVVVALTAGWIAQTRFALLLDRIPVTQAAVVPPVPVEVLALTQAFTLPAGWGGSALVSPATIAYLIAAAPPPPPPPASGAGRVPAPPVASRPGASWGLPGPSPLDQVPTRSSTRPTCTGFHAAPRRVV